MMEANISPTLTQRLTEWFNKNPESKTGSGELAKAINIPVDRVSDGLKKLFDRGMLHRCEIQRKGQRMTYVYWKKSIESAPPKPYKPATAVRREIKSWAETKLFPPNEIEAAVVSPAPGDQPVVSPGSEGASSPASPNTGSHAPDTSFQSAPAGGMAVARQDAAEASSSAASANVIAKLQNELRVQTERGEMLAHAIVSFCEWLPTRITCPMPMNLHQAKVAIIDATKNQPAMGYIVHVMGISSKPIADKSKALAAAEELALQGERVAVAAVVAEAQTRVEWRTTA